MRYDSVHMLLQGYEIGVTADSVDVKRDDSRRSIRVRAYGSIGIIAFAVVLFYFIVFGSHRGYSTWWNLTNEPGSSGDFLNSLIAFVVASGLSGFLLILGLRNFFPSGERLHCDRSTFTVSKIPWFNFHGKWTRHSFSIAEISQLRFAVVRSSRGNSLCGICCFAHGKQQKLFAGLEAPEASRILRGLKNLGADVCSDPDMLTKVQETLRERRSRI